MEADTQRLVAENAASEQVIRSPLRHLEPELVSARARAESRNRELHLPPIGTYRWWARRTEAVNGAIIDAVAQDRVTRMLVSDPFAGGGVIPLAAAMRGHDVYAQDLSPWAASGLGAMLALPTSEALQNAFAALQQRVSATTDAAYGTLFSDGTPADVSHTFRVAVSGCGECGHRAPLYPHALVSLRSRAERGEDAAFLACPNGHLFEGIRSSTVGCPTCDEATDPTAVYTAARRVKCVSCGNVEKLDARASAAPFEWQVVLVERSTGRRRELAIPRPSEVSQADDPRWAPSRDLGMIPAGQETSVLRRHGFRGWVDLFPRRQRWVTETLLAHLEELQLDAPTRNAVMHVVVGATEMAGLLSRWDRFYLKSYESMANHRFNFTTFTAEPNVWGTKASGRGTVRRRMARMLSSARWWDEHVGRDYCARALHASNAHIVDLDSAYRATVVCGSSERQLLPDGSCDLALTDPPYHDDVQYDELSLPLRAWAGLSTDSSSSDVAINPTISRDESQSDLLSRIFRETNRTLRPDGHLIFSFANRDARAWVELITALHSAGLRTAGTEIIHSENESDLAKRNVRACTLDLILDMVPRGAARVESHKPRIPQSDEGDFLRIVSSYVHRVGTLAAGWEDEFRDAVSSHPFIATKRPTAVPARGR